MTEAVLDFTRQSDLIPGDRAAETSVTIIGAGAVGSHTVEVLAKMGVRDITIFDYDDVEIHNIANQGFGLDELGMQKVDALKSRLLRTTGVEITAMNEKIEASRVFESDIVISAVDSMAVRKLLWEGVNHHTSATSLWVDGRMGAMYGIVYAIPMSDMKKIGSYEASLHTDADGFQAPCTAKATIFCAQWMASMIGATVAKAISGAEQPTYRTDMSFEDNKLLRFC